MPQSIPVFQKYASAYDTLYQDKNYVAECDFLQEIFGRYALKPVQKILDLGCGTGGHVIPLVQRDYQVMGVDRSPQMIEQARQKTSNLPPNLISFACDTIQHFNAGHTFDAVICMFAVLSYQTTNTELITSLQTVRHHLTPGGLFICDFWYGPAVLYQRPSEKVKIVQRGQERIIRLTRPELNLLENHVTVNFDLFCLQDNQLIEEIQEVHSMRYFFKPEIDFFMTQAGLQLVHFAPFLEFDRPASELTWNVMAVARAI